VTTMATAVWNMKAIHAGDISPVGVVVSSVRGLYDGVVVPVKDWAIDMHGDGPHRDHSEAMTGALGTVVLMAIMPGEGAVGEETLAFSLCFAEGTKVLMADRSTKSIEEVREGDVVLADEPQDARAAEPRKVTQVHRTATYRLFHVEIGDRDGGEIIATGSHPFWTQRGWVTAKELTNRDVLTDDVGRAISIRAIAIESRDALTFNLSIEGTHTFFVVGGSTSVLVHNVDPYDVSFSQSSYGRTFAEGEWAGKSLVEAAAEARALGRLPNGLTLNVMEVNNQWVALNNRTLAVARMANLSEVAINDVGPSGMNKLQQLLRGSDLLSPVETAVMRCK
ncbi:MAG: Hint domain-containing protein, partial [Byssovorax sp.]